MICHKCNQDSLDIENGHIICDVCGLDIDISLNLEEDPFLDLFFYNRNLEEAEKLGREAMTDGKELGGNPYTVSSDQIMLNKKWEEGYNREKESYEFAALSLSAKKISTELREEVALLKQEKEELENKIGRFIPTNHKFIKDDKQGILRVYLKYDSDNQSAMLQLTRVSKPSRRVYTKGSEIKPVLSGTGISILSTSRGVMTDKQARKENVGGEVLCNIW